MDRRDMVKSVLGIPMVIARSKIEHKSTHVGIDVGRVVIYSPNGKVLLDTCFSTISLCPGDSIQFTAELPNDGRLKGA